MDAPPVGYVTTSDGDDIAYATIQNHVSSILNETGLANRAEAVAYALRHGIA
jgi:DNA-binding NarL/FixJ family response regulator